MCGCNLKPTTGVKVQLQGEGVESKSTLRSHACSVCTDRNMRHCAWPWQCTRAASERENVEAGQHEQLDKLCTAQVFDGIVCDSEPDWRMYLYCLRGWQIHAIGPWHGFVGSMCALPGGIVVCGKT